METQPVKIRKNRDVTGLIIKIVITILTFAAAMAAYTVTRSLVSSWNITDIPGAPVEFDPLTMSSDSTPDPKLTGTDISIAGLPPTIQPTPVQWDGVRRITILILGLDYRDWEAGEKPRSDTMILVTVDPISKTAGMLSIPRDMWTLIPGTDYYKINTAYFLGGPQLATDTVEQFLGVPVDYYAQIDFNAFVKFIDSLGGLDMKIREAIKVDPVGPGNTIILEPGTQTLSGAVALAYARNRYTKFDDFDRAKRQQEVIMAVRNQVVNLKMIPTLVAKSPRLYKDLSSGIHTNLTLDQVIRLAYLMEQIPPEKISKGVIGTNMVSFAKSSDGLDILLPVPDRIRELRDSIFNTSVPPAREIYGDDWPELLKQEGARVEISDASRVDGTGERTATYLREKGINVTGVSNSSAYSTVSYVKSYTGMVYTTGYLADLFGMDGYQIQNSYQQDSPMDITLMIGSDWVKKGLLP
jgi:polyisoprenyl-teichoic acid--peptidoglycan teichoic acid transferase